MQFILCIKCVKVFLAGFIISVKETGDLQNVKIALKTQTAPRRRSESARVKSLFPTNTKSHNVKIGSEITINEILKNKFPTSKSLLFEAIMNCDHRSFSSHSFVSST